MVSRYDAKQGVEMVYQSINPNTWMDYESDRVAINATDAVAIPIRKTESSVITIGIDQFSL